VGGRRPRVRTCVAYADAGTSHQSRRRRLRRGPSVLADVEFGRVGHAGQTVIDSFEIAKYFWTDSSPTVRTEVSRSR
jgi:hypothetical protein